MNKPQNQTENRVATMPPAAETTGDLGAVRIHQSVIALIALPCLRCRRRSGGNERVFCRWAGQYHWQNRSRCVWR